MIEVIRKRLTNLRDESIVESLMTGVTTVKSIPMLTKWSTRAATPLLELSYVLLDRLPVKTEADRAAKTRVAVYLPLFRAPIPMASAA